MNEEFELALYQSHCNADGMGEVEFDIRREDQKTMRHHTLKGVANRKHLQ